jgi:nucleoside-diphosphate-sugar epimerase
MNIEIPELRDVTALEAHLSEPGDALVEDFSGLSGDLLVLGAGGKMGPTLAMMARKALDRAGSSAKVIAVARFSDAEVKPRLEASGVEVLACDLLDADAVRTLPDAPHVLFMAGMKFGASGNPATTWAMNALCPAIVAERFAQSRIVVFSSGNIYPFVGVGSAGATEETPTGPVGEYAQSVLARERMFEYFAHREGTSLLQYRLNYAVEPRYGVPVDLAQKILASEPIDLSMGYVNLIWQRDANEIALRCLTRTACPPEILNVTGTEVLSVRNLAEKLAARLEQVPMFLGHEEPEALLADAAKCVQWFGQPPTPVDAMLDAVASWVRQGGALLGKPTKFQVRDGKF